ncbi:MAG: RNA methyltransferase [Clostridia bacterium]|nr:RNA methyltransferase [Clostridia bacterium]
MKCGRCVVKLNEKDKVKKIDRWQKIAEVAAKQSGRDIIPTINNVINIKNICNIIPKYDIVLLAYEKEANNSLKNELLKIKEKDFNRIGVIIGPEGGIDEKEADLLKQAGVKIITLGKRILRTETVALSVLSNIMYEFDM